MHEVGVSGNLFHDMWNHWKQFTKELLEGLRNFTFRQTPNAGLPFPRPRRTKRRLTKKWIIVLRRRNLSISTARSSVTIYMPGRFLLPTFFSFVLQILQNFKRGQRMFQRVSESEVCRNYSRRNTVQACYMHGNVPRRRLQYRLAWVGFFLFGVWIGLRRRGNTACPIA